MQAREQKSALPGPTIAPGLFRRLAAIVYDTFLLAALLFAATAAILPFNAGVAFTPRQLFYPAYLIGIGFLFFAWFWTHGGQTLGMRAWKIKILTFDRQPISWRQAALRFVSAFVSWALFGLGFWWILFDKQQCGWHDHWSQTAIYFETDAAASR